VTFASLNPETLHPELWHLNCKLARGEGGQELLATAAVALQTRAPKPENLTLLLMCDDARGEGGGVLSGETYFSFSFIWWQRKLLHNSFLLVMLEHLYSNFHCHQMKEK
jgi:hypothetical protein